jgi:hypothetical protein
MILSVHQPQYIPWLGYFHKIERSDCFVVLDQVQYKAREYQNRNRILSKDGPLWLTVPVKSKSMGRQMICDIQIDNSNGWKNKHWSTLKTSYSRTGSFNEHFPFFEEAYGRQWDTLADLNMFIIHYMLKELEITTPVYFESDLGITASKTDRIIAICKKLNADAYLSGTGGKEYLEEEKFAQESIKLMYQEFAHPDYQQQYKGERKRFIPCLSAIDLLFNEGGKSKDILRGKNGDN